ncbi:Chitinase 2 [Dispira simplex]|nr:Chitinase 2 [Dispira simplex]
MVTAVWPYVIGLWCVLWGPGSFALAGGFDQNCKSNLVLYWGQNSYGAANPSDSANWEQPLAHYCQDDTVDVLVLAFLHIFNAGTDKLPGTNFANHCNTTFAGSDLHHCPEIGKDIQYCQSKGKKVLLSLGGAAGSYGFANDGEGKSFADKIWNLFLGGQSDKRPFGNAVLDGVDLDIEGGSNVGYSAFVDTLRSRFSSDLVEGLQRRYYVAAAPQCPYPDAYMGSVLKTSWVDMVYVQFYNNYCGVHNYPQYFNFDEWQNWANKVSVNKDVKIYLGVPGAKSAASSGYIGVDRLREISQKVQQTYSSFGGVMMWDASQSYNNRAGGSSYAAAAKAALLEKYQCRGGTSVPQPKPTTGNPGPSTPSLPAASTTSRGSHPTPRPNEGCIQEVSPCDSEGAYACSGYNFAQCDQGRWILRSCSTDKSLVCFQGNNGGVYCDKPNGRPIPTCPGAKP